nr:polysaccharide lyase family 8 super-sandwich domain-containing protein [Ruania suaedae]
MAGGRACPLDPDGFIIAPGNYEAQAHAVVANLRQALADLGADLTDVVSHRVLVASSDQADLVRVWNVVRAAFGDRDVPSTLMGVTVLGCDAQLVEVEAVAVLPDPPLPSDGVFDVRPSGRRLPSGGCSITVRVSNFHLGNGAMKMNLTASRRTFLVGTAAALAAAGTIGTGSAALAAEPFDGLVDRRREFLTGGEVAATHPELAEKRASIDAEVSELVDTFVRTTGRTGLWPDLRIGAASNTAEVGNMGVTANRITMLATAWASAGSEYYQDPDLRSDLQGALWFLSGQYRADRGRPGNWWFWEIGLPRQLADTLILLGDDAPAEAVDLLIAAIRFHAPDPNVRRDYPTLKETGANRVDKALSCIMRGLIDEDVDDVILGRDALSDVAGDGANSVFGRVTSGDGFYDDGSFVQHGYLPYSGTYGGVAITGVAEVLALLAGSEWAVTDPDVNNLFESIDLTFAPFQWDVRTMDTTRGRAVSRQQGQDFHSGFAIASAVLVLADSAPEADATRYQAMVKGWLERTEDQPLATNTQTLAATARSLAVAENDDVTAAGPRTGTTNTYHQERIVHHRGDWAAVVNTSSSRIGRYEWGNRENNLGWYQGDGMMFLYHREDSAQYSADFWPTVDPYALPGTTVTGEERESGLGDGTGIPRAQNAYAGGLTLAGELGTTAMDLQNFSDNLRANKSWFYLPDRVVCVGSGITDSSGTGARTIAENRSFPVGEVPAVQVDGEDVTLEESPRPASAVHVANHAGVVALAPVGAEEVPAWQVRAETRTGSWQTINDGSDTGGTDEEVSRAYVRIEREHTGDDDWYAYQVLPLAEAGTIVAEAAEPTVTVLLADPAAHLIEASDGTRMGHFFAEGTFAGYTVSGPCAVAHRRAPHATGGRAAAGAFRTEIVVSQPTKSGGTLSVSFDMDAPGTLVNADDSVQVVATSPLELAVDADIAPGSEHRIVFASLATAEPVTVEHLDTEGEPIADPVIIEGEIGQSYEAEPLALSGYLDPEIPDNATGTIAEVPITVTFVYEPEPSPSPTDDGSGSTPTPTATTGTGTVTPTDPGSTGSTGGSGGGLANTGSSMLPLGAGALAATALGAAVLAGRRRGAVAGEAEDCSGDTEAAPEQE